ncbi:MAG: DUF368 domain-containing protein [Planctomycetes bacterium]|nr:DUF368 domain-containing protein [Planctomycetota bacterium]
MKAGLFLRGMCMGIADIIPGVSGGTMALVLGIYGQFIAAVKSLNLRPVLALCRWAAKGFKAEGKAQFLTACETVHWRFLLPLVSGIALAMGVGSVIIPRLMDDHPAEMRGLFFGLILASVGVPLKMMPRHRRQDLVLGLTSSLLFLGLGYLVTDPNRQVDTVSNWRVLHSEEPTELKDICRRGPSAASSAEVYWAERNEALRAAIARTEPVLAAELEAHRPGQTLASDKDARKDLARPYDALVVPAGTPVALPRPSYLFILCAGTIAICAMVLPGISGSFILLILGCYYFVLNAVKGSLGSLVHLRWPGDGLLYVILFALGCLIGLAAFSRVLNWLLRRLPAPTMGALVGLMLGCLRGVWPWRQVTTTEVSNILPPGAEAWPAALIAVLGMAIALTIEYLGARRAPAAED